jgi:hypothetical protein
MFAALEVVAALATLGVLPVQVLNVILGTVSHLLTMDADRSVTMQTTNPLSRGLRRNL